MLTQQRDSVNEERRIAALRGYKILNTLREKEFDRITELTSITCNTPIASISFIDEHRVWLKSTIGLEEDQLPRSGALCDYTVQSQKFFEVQDTTLDERFCDSALVTSHPHIRFYAGYPLLDPYGNILGTLCVMDLVPRKLSDDQVRALALLAQNVIDLVMERRQKEEFRSFERMFRLSPHLICIYRPELPYLKLNPSLCRLTGLHDNLLSNHNWRNVIHNDDWEKVISAFNEVSEDDTEVVITTRVLSNLGIYRSVEWVISVEHATGHLYALGRDITDELELNSKLRHTTQLLEETNQVARIGGWEIDLENCQLRWTKMTRAIHAVPDNYEPDITTAIEFYKDAAVRKQVRKDVENAIANGTSWSSEVQIVDANGVSKWVHALGKAEMQDGKCLRVYGTFQDIDEKKKIQLENENSRAILQAFVRHNPAAVAMFDREMRYIAVSNTWLQNYRLSDKVVIGQSYYDLFPFITEAGRARHQRILAGAIEQHSEDWSLFRESEFGGYYSWEMRPWHLIDGSIGGLLIYTQDVSQQVEQRQKLIEAKSDAEAANDAKTKFLTNVSHELRTPLNGILGFAELALHCSTEDDKKQFIDLVIKSGKSLLQIINNMLDYSQLESHNMVYNVEKTDLHDLIQRSVDGVKADAFAKNLRFTSHLASGIPRFVWIDALRVRQILYNLLINAIKFTHEGEIVLRVDHLYDREESATFRFTVSDTGIGISPENQTLIFEPFAQEDGSVTRQYGGTGLGLTVSKKLLQLMGSSLKVQSTPKVGSTFHFDLTVRSANS
ncbi:MULTISPECIES: sensor histidine kinase [Sphingobacterium]|uniref:histidine kinase n=1 Tax=Sphingobacterium populi TaxID=1812824 RepID=A0ABW5UFF2_9SPHI|nr:ATP-binding protein [Sphingobacterium sp. CFCC 11742]